MADLTPVDYDPFAKSAAPTLTPVDHDPFAEPAPKKARAKAAASPSPLDVSGFTPATSAPANPFLSAPSIEPDLTRVPTVTQMLRPSAPLSVPGGRVGAMGRAAEREVLPTGTAAMGAATGAEVGALGGPLDPLTIPAGALIGGGLGYWAGKKGQQSVMDNWVPQGTLQSVGQTPAQVRADQLLYPVSTGLAATVPSLVGGGALQRAMTSPEIADMAMMTGASKTKTPTTSDTINATRAAAERQGISLPTTLTSPTGYKVSRLLPGLGSGSIDTAERAAPQAVGDKLRQLSETYLKPTEPGEAGAAIQDAAAQWAEKQRLTGGDLIKSAGKQAAGIPLAPTSTLDYIDKEIARLSTNPIANSSQIKMLSGLKGDLSNPDNPLDLASLHDLQSSLYRNAVPEGLSASAAAKTRGDLWHTLSDDIQGGLSTAADGGNTAAHDALQDFNAGSEVWKTRADAIKTALGKVIGGSADEIETQSGDVTRPLFVGAKSPEAAAKAVSDMTTSDRRGFKTLMGTLDPDAQDTVRASVIASLGRDPAGNFSTPIFLKQMHSIPDVTRDTLFGAEHSAALDDLETITRNIGQAGPRSHGWGSLGVEMAIPAIFGLTHGGAYGAGTGILAVGGVNSTAAYFLSRPDTLKWVAKLAKATSNGTTESAMGRLATAARSSPALASMYDNIQQTATALANQPAKPAKKDDKPDVYDPSKLSDEELGMTAATPQGSPAPSEAVPIDPTAYPNKPLDELIPKVIGAESGGDAHAVSPKGAEGLLQAMPATQHDPGFGVAPVADNSLAEKNRVGEDYLKAMINLHGGNQVLALMSHNWGPGHVDRWVKGGMTGKVPKETRDYVEKILGTD